MARTKATLHHALMALIQEKGYDAITVENICTAANVGRSTFYAHYTGKDDLRRSGLDYMRVALIAQHREALAKPADTRNQRFGFSLALFEHARAHVEGDQAPVGSRGRAAALGAIRQVVAELVRDELNAANPSIATESIPPEFIAEYVSGAFMAVLAWWTDEGAKLPPQRIDAMFRRLAIQGLPSAP